MTSNTAQEEWAYVAGVQAYVYGYPLVEIVRTCALMTAVDAPTEYGRAPVNQFSHCPRPWTHEDRDVVTPANDLLYSMAWLNLADGPVVLTTPAPTGRYFVIELVDAYSDNFRNLGPRVVGPDASRFALVGPDWSGTLPDGTEEIRCPTNLVWVLGRVLIDGADDMQEARAFQAQFTLTATGKSRLPQSVVDYQPSSPSGIAFFDNLARAMQDNPPPARDASLVAQFARLGLARGRRVDTGAAGEARLAGLQRAVKAGAQLIEGHTRSRRALPWSINYAGGRLGTDYLARACTAMKGLGALASDEALYALGDFDANGEQLDGARQYVLHFPAGQLPPVDAFWSVSIYGSDFYFADNPIRRYAIGDRSRDLRRGEDGSLDIQIQHTEPQQGISNWLPAPAGRFYLILRLYHPRKEILTRDYVIPAVRRVDESTAR
ncbi:DUF1254 domain-containing protein [Paraburkholderia sartisoli]|uniref:Uncharacterized conserved protein n=1 Tax=Paraburkholderia sartisoli TaxID=83784 RepID=A0A1H4GV39_9BURK|nr:DUF1254 domain-containing protein [Paraburkholderia sartisoli]SEB13181.1 Uncharacterized conserved protein [Paraburkholderia sartisoli]